MFQKQKIVFNILISTSLVFALGLSFVSQYTNFQNSTPKKIAHASHLINKEGIKYSLENFESLECEKYQIQPYGSFNCEVRFKTDVPEAGLGMMMVHWVNTQNPDNVAMLGCDYKNPENKKVLFCENDIMFIQKGDYYAELSLSEQIKGNITDKILKVDGEPLPYEITETVDIS
jgi:hypothetical protein